MALARSTPISARFGIGHTNYPPPLPPPPPYRPTTWLPWRCLLLLALRPVNIVLKPLLLFWKGQAPLYLSLWMWLWRPQTQRWFCHVDFRRWPLDHWFVYVTLWLLLFLYTLHPWNLLVPRTGNTSSFWNATYLTSFRPVSRPTGSIAINSILTSNLYTGNLHGSPTGTTPSTRSLHWSNTVTEKFSHFTSHVYGL